MNYDKFKENVDYVSIGSNINDGSYETNVIKYNENGKIHSIKIVQELFMVTNMIFFQM